MPHKASQTHHGLVRVKAEIGTNAVDAHAAVQARVRSTLVAAVVFYVGSGCQRWRAGAGEDPDAIRADAAVQARAVPAVVVLWAARDIAARAGDAAGLGGGDAICVLTFIAAIRRMTVVHGQPHIDFIAAIIILRYPGGAVHALNKHSARPQLALRER